MELCALHLKREGALLARTLSYAGAEFSVVEATLTPEQIETYDRAAQLWQILFTRVEARLATMAMRIEAAAAACSSSAFPTATAASRRAAASASAAARRDGAGARRPLHRRRRGVGPGRCSRGDEPRRQAPGRAGRHGCGRVPLLRDRLHAS